MQYTGSYSLITTWHVHTANTQISLHIRWGCLEFSAWLLGDLKKPCILNYPQGAQQYEVKDPMFLPKKLWILDYAQSVQQCGKSRSKAFHEKSFGSLTMHRAPSNVESQDPRRFHKKKTKSFRSLWKVKIKGVPWKKLWVLDYAQIAQQCGKSRPKAFNKKKSFGSLTMHLAPSNVKSQDRRRFHKKSFGSMTMHRSPSNVESQESKAFLQKCFGFLTIHRAPSNVESQDPRCFHRNFWFLYYA